MYFAMKEAGSRA